MTIEDPEKLFLKQTHPNSPPDFLLGVDLDLPRRASDVECL